MTGEWRRLRDEELYALYSPKYHSSETIKKNGLGGSCGLYGGQDRCTQGFGGKD
jgi:hypothetical protein